MISDMMSGAVSGLAEAVFRRFDKRDDATSAPHRLVDEIKGPLISFLPLALEAHKSVRISLEENNSESLEIAFQNLERTINAHLIKYNKNIVDFLKTTSCINKSNKKFGNHKARPHFMVVESYDNKNKIIDILRSSEIRKTPIENNTGFFKTYTSQETCIFNNIPVAAIEGAYTNPRLDCNRLRNDFYNSGKDNKVFRFDANWQSYWSPYNDGQQKDPASCYRSTIVTPISLDTANIDSDLLKYMESHGFDNQSMLFGFYCLDHACIDFFSLEDQIIIESVADLFAIFLFFRNMLTSWSDTYSKASVVRDLCERNVNTNERILDGPEKPHALPKPD